MTPPAVSVKMPVVSASSRMPSTNVSSLTARAQPPLSRRALAANVPSAGFPIAIERAMVFGISGTMWSSPRSRRRTIGAHPAACAPYKRGGAPDANSAESTSPNPLRSLVTTEPPAIGAMTAVGNRHPSCSAISNAIVFEPSP